MLKRSGDIPIPGSEESTTGTLDESREDETQGIKGLSYGRKRPK